MVYTSLEDKLIMPEYGRNIQHMVEYALTIEDRDERAKCVKSIVQIMGNMFPYLRDVNDFKHKLWDHVAIMSGFKLDIDYPYEILSEQNLYTQPEVVPYQNSNMRYLHYGRTLEKMIEIISSYQEGEEKTELIRLIANQMKKCFLTWNKEVVDDKKIYDDLRELSKGAINVSEDSLKLVESKDILQGKKMKPRKK